VPDLLDELVYLSNFLGQDSRLVQPGGGNTSAKLRLTSDSGEPVQALAVKGSGTDLRTIGPDGFTWLSLARLAPLRHAEKMSDA
jgi:rhamnose utilization protein RhaD (predicted bifunctional aldolase and dehydrogenase)